MSPPVTPLLSVEGLRVGFPGAAEPAVRGLGFHVDPAETVALVGESGCGKSTTALAVMGLLPRGAEVRGRVLLEGENLTGVSERRMEAIRGQRMSMIFQEPMTSLNPVLTVGAQIAEVLRHHESLSRRAARARVLDMLDLVRLPDPARRIGAYPHELSGGQRQRVMIAMAIACRPRLLVADEPTTALDATIQQQILELLDDLRRDLSMALLLITHDLALVSRWADRVVVMHHGEKMEELPADKLFGQSAHPYTRGLIGASIRLDGHQHVRLGRLPEVRATRDADGHFGFALTTPAAPPPRPARTGTVLTVRDLVTEYRSGAAVHRAVDGVSFDIGVGETLGLVGESGCGKSSLARTILRLIPAAAGSVSVAGQDITGRDGGALRQARQKVQMIFQDPYGSLNPRRSVGAILETPLIVGGIRDGRERQRLVAEALDRVGLPAAARLRYPHEFSGGQRQRIGIARALIVKPALVICDEPVSALDVSVQAQILNLLSDLQASLGLSYLFISHDLAVVRYFSDRVIVMKDGRLVEESDHETIWTAPQHDYTRHLIRSVSAGRAVDSHVQNVHR